MTRKKILEDNEFGIDKAYPIRTYRYTNNCDTFFLLNLPTGRIMKNPYMSSSVVFLSTNITHLTKVKHSNNVRFCQRLSLSSFSISSWSLRKCRGYWKVIWKKSRFNPDTANTVIIILIVLVHIYARFYGVSPAEAVQSENVNHLTNYLLQFHNNHGNTCMIIEVHAALVEHYCEDDAEDTWREQTTS